jgi:hypothetical protein
MVCRLANFFVRRWLAKRQAFGAVVEPRRDAIDVSAPVAGLSTAIEISERGQVLNRLAEIDVIAADFPGQCLMAGVATASIAALITHPVMGRDRGERPKV